MMNAKKNIYIVFLSTQSKMGQFIRFISQNEYNHVSISFDDDLHKLYSFARYFKTSPFLGGFVEESILRYCQPGQEAAVKIIKIPVSLSQYHRMKKYINNMRSTPSSYIYNTLSALLTPIHKKVTIINAFTCIEFIVHLLSKFRVIDMDLQNQYYSICDLEKILSTYMVFEGRITEIAKPLGWEEDMFCQNRNRILIFLYTLRQFGRLAFRKLIL